MPFSDRSSLGMRVAVLYCSISGTKKTDSAVGFDRCSQEPDSRICVASIISLNDGWEWLTYKSVKLNDAVAPRPFHLPKPQIELRFAVSVIARILFE